jgi:L-lactate dehydrogenase complex protein LldF
MRAPIKTFLREAEQRAFDPKHRRTLNFNIGQYNQKVPQGKAQFGDLEKARALAKNVKWHAMENLERYLLQFEERFTANGGKVIWAENAEEAAAAVLRIAEEHGVSHAVKSKSMVTEEIHLNAALEKAGIEVLETDLGEYIVQLEDSRPYHIITPIMHKSKEDVAALFHEKFGLPSDATPETVAGFVRNLLREKYRTAGLGITGCNFLVADTGGVGLTENEGNGRLSTTFPKVHVAISGIEKIIPSIHHLELFWPLLGTFGTGQKLTVYNSIFHGPRRADEHDGPEAMYVILLDNGRTDILANPRQRESLYCIRCGACLNACPVYRNIGGHAYGSTYSGPIGKVITPNLSGLTEFGHLSDASSLCGACTETCPVNIRLHELILDNRHEEVLQHVKTPMEKRIWSLWRRAMLNRAFMNVPSFLKRFFLRYFFRGAWGERRQLPEIEKASFNKLWRNGAV